MLTNKLGLPEPFVQAATSNHQYKPKRYSVTDLLGGTCEAILKRRHAGEGEEDVADRIWQIFGTAVHDVLRRAEATETQLQENWLSVPIVNTGYELSGIFDLYDDATGEVVDYKTGSIYKVKFADFADWRKQTLMYVWMLRKLGFNAHKGKIVCLLKDHNKREARIKANDGYPQHPVFQIGWEFGIEDLGEAAAHILLWFTNVIAQEQLPDEQLTPCSPEQRWHKDDKWAVKKKGRKTAIRVLGSEEEAHTYAEQHGIDLDSPTYSIEYRPGEDTKCEGYCPVKDFCPHYQAIMAAKTQD